MNRVVLTLAACIVGLMIGAGAILVLPSLALDVPEEPAAPPVVQATAGNGARDVAVRQPPSANPRPKATPTVRVTLGGYNIENFFDRHDDPYNGDEVMRPKSDESLAKAAQVIAATDADFLGIVEMEKLGALAAFVDERLPDRGYRFLWVNQTVDLRGINNGFLSRLRPHSMTIYRFNELTLEGADRTWPFARDVLEAELRPAEGVRLSVFVVHFKSKRDGPNDPDSVKWRTAEMLALRRIIAERLAEDPDAMIAVVGDFNDTPGSAPLDALTGSADKPGVLVDVTASLPPDKRITYLRQPYRSQVDYVMASPALARCFVPGSAKVVQVTDMMEASDHAPVIATFALPAPGSD